MGFGLRLKIMGVSNSLKRTLRAGDYWYWLPPQKTGGEIPIYPLVYPLRYDILVRKTFFDFYESHSQIYRDDLDAFIDLARKHVYHAWFTRVLIPRFEADSLNDERHIHALFVKRVRSAVALHDSIRKRGFDTAHPIIPYTGERILPTSTGYSSSQEYYMGDGCHRLACLMSMGYRSLPRDLVKVKCFRRLEPLDNTALLEGRIPIDWPPDLLQDNHEGGGA